MSGTTNGELVPVGGGDVIPLIRETLSLGRRESCDICLRFPNVSGVHCELTFKDGCWTIKDLGSTNGIKINGDRVQQKLLNPGDIITIAKRSFTIEYTQNISKQALAEIMEDTEGVMDIPLLQKAGLEKPEKAKPKRKPWETVEEEGER